MTKEEKQIYDKAYSFAEKMHSGQKRIGGEPYITHPKAVADMMIKEDLPIEYVLTALFHDLLEDTKAEESQILELGGEEVLKAVKLLTKEKGYNMSEYVSRIRNNPIAFKVKGADRLHNLKSAFCASKEFKKHYIEETSVWYTDFSPEIPKALNELKKSF